jgi:alpha-L-fucosidase
MSNRLATDARMLAGRLKFALEAAGITRRGNPVPNIPPAQAALYRDFREKGFGMFIHFNSATFQFCRDEGQDWAYGIIDNRNPGYHFFSPADFTATSIDFDQWADAALSAGCKFTVLTAKHHEGFALWPTRATDHSIAASPYPGDLVADYMEAMRRRGLVPGLYFSMLDLHHNITEAGVSPSQKELIKQQLTELLSDYGEVPYLVIDGWNSLWGGPRFSQLDYGEIAGHIKSQQPGTLIMNHSCECSYDHTEVIFFENAAGQAIPKYFDGFGAAGNILTRTWFWKESHPAAKLKSAAWAVEKKLRPMNRQGVTFLLNVSPNREGCIEENVAQRFYEIGELYELHQV